MSTLGIWILDNSKHPDRKGTVQLIDGTSSWTKMPHLDEQISKIDILIAETERFIELAQKRRSALITAAVTGQIDVREVS